MNNIRVKALGAVLAAFAIIDCHAEPADEPAEGTLFRSLFGDSLQRDYGISVSNLLDVGYSRNNRSTHDERRDGLSNFPITGMSDEGLELGSLHLFVDKALQGTFVPRITPLPGPRPEAFSFGFTFEANYGRNAQFARTYGWDMGLHLNQKDAAKAQKDEDLFLALPNFAATAYLPYGPGISLMAGVFGPAQGYEIPPNVRFARNPFASKTYAFVSEPGTVAGVLGSVRVKNDDSGILGLELGVVQGWNNLRDNNDSKSLMGALRWRTADMNTWVDYEFLVGDEQNDGYSDVQAPPSRVIADSGQLKQQHSLNGWHKFNDQWSMGAELVYGHQAGDGKASTVDVVTGPGFDGAHWWGANAVVTWQFHPRVSLSVRGEHFEDPDGYALFPTSTARGNYNALTTGLRWDLTRSLVLRPEVRYDWFDARDHDRPYGNGRDRTRLGTMVEALYYF
ncbi:outer membrane beta-barrel protein [Pseudomonas citronellolis]|uniref:outer membrane beta-barrel protein n=1 Tax=Pseudomonas citronellolis TaxID=53408 RepID=UPI0026481916|nr:outer membrane beta-barrel protein [Pseudomonas citronellolis]MDN6876469.1 outer membrane beta-barrel protein [Pseudomonas citronellolis]